MSCRVTILCDNTVGPVSGTLGEHGFAALIERDGASILFDTGQGATLLHNAARMKKNLSAVEKVVLSHGHFDHGGGLLPLLQHAGGKTVVAHPDIFQSRFRVKDTGEVISIGMPATRQQLEESGAVFQLTADAAVVAEGMYLTGAVPRLTTFERGDRGLFADREGDVVDCLTDDQSLVIVTDKGLLLVLGCCHAGLINTIEAARQVTGVDAVYAVIGGTHLGFCDRDQLENSIIALRKIGVKKICAGHCTGFQASARLAREFGWKFQQAAVGFTIEV
jgi:7,8-dihydropterin-6-yl-methyl-4-(beta-D-ribofuranosyl)aminobenzene 5'-phosphate synthase